MEAGSSGGGGGNRRRHHRRRNSDSNSPSPNRNSRRQPQAKKRPAFSANDDDRDRDDEDEDDISTGPEEAGSNNHEQRDREPRRQHEPPPPKPRAYSRTGSVLQDSIDLPRQIERLQRDLQRRDQELVEERRETERALQRIRKLERDKSELEQELEEVRDEVNDYVIKLDEFRKSAVSTPKMKGKDQQLLTSQVSGSEENVEELQRVMQEKNYEIERLLEDLEKLEADKHTLHVKLTDVRDSLQDATSQIETMTVENGDLKHSLEASDGKIKKLEEDKAVLEIKERDLLTFKERHEKYLENLCSAVDVRVDVWKRMMVEKDEEIDRLNIKIAALLAQIPNTQIDSDKTTIRQMKKKIIDREEQINLLNQQLSQATVDIEAHTKTIQDLQTKLDYTENNDKTQKFVHSLESKLKKYVLALQQRSIVLHSYEKEIEERSREVTMLTSRLHEYESGQYGLVDAIAEIKQVKAQLRVRDKQIESLTQDVNQLQLQKQDYSDENELLRSRGGVGQKSLRDETAEYVKSRQNDVEKFKARIRILENDTIQLKSKNYGLRKEINELMKSRKINLEPELDEDERAVIGPGKRSRGHGVASSPSARRDAVEGYGTGMALSLQNDRVDLVDAHEWKEKYDVILGENTELRKGLVEILDSMRRLSDEKSSSILIESPILENLLREMSARGLINYPHPVSGFHLKVCNIEGKNSQLREEIHRLRYEEKQLRIELLETKVQLQTFQDRLQTIEHSPTSRRPRSKSQESASKSPSRNVALTSVVAKSAEFLNTTTADPQHISHTFSIQSPKSIIENQLRTELLTLRDDNNNLKSTHAKEKSHLESQLESLVQKGNEIIQLANVGRNSDSEIITTRKFQFLQFLIEISKKENHHLHLRISELENESNAKLSFLERFRMRALDQIGHFQNVLESSVPISALMSTKRELETLAKDLEELSIKNNSLTVNCMKLEKFVLETAELKRLNEKLKKELEHSQIVIKSLNVTSTDSMQAEYTADQGQVPVKLLQLQAENQQLTGKLEQSGHELESLTSKNHELEKSHEELTKRSNELLGTVQKLESNEKAHKFNTSMSVQLEEHEELQTHLRSIQEALSCTKDELLKWKDLVELGQNQMMAMENIKNFEKMELESLVSQISDLQATDLDKVELVRVKREMVSCEKEKSMAVQQLLKAQTKLSNYEVLSLQQQKQHSDREMTLLSMHTQVISRYRNLFTAIYENYTNNAVQNLQSSVQIQEAWELFGKCKVQCEELESELIQTHTRSDALEEKCLSLEEVLSSMREGQVNTANNNGGGHGQVHVDLLSRFQEAKLEAARWKRKSEHADRKISSLVDNLHRLEAKTVAMEEDRIRYEHSIDLKESLAQLLAIPSDPQDRQSKYKTAAFKDVSTCSSSQISLAHVTSRSQLVQTEENLSEVYSHKLQINELKAQISQLETLLNAKDKVFSEFKVLHIEPYKASQEGGILTKASIRNPELAEALQVAQDSIINLQDRLKVKEDNIGQYRKLLADVRHEMSTASERHVQEMKALQLTIYQQQQAFTRMKSTLSQPVKDTVNIEGSLEDQLTRINELEEEVSDLQHTLGNVASQLTSARSDAHKWRAMAESRVKELDMTRDHLTEETLEEVKLLREKIRHQDELFREFRFIGPSTSTSGILVGGRASNEDIRKESEIVQVLRTELAEREKRLESCNRTIQALKQKTGVKFTDKQTSEENLLKNTQDKEINDLRENNRQLHAKVTALTLKISKLKAVNLANHSSGLVTEIESLRLRAKEDQDERLKLQEKLDERQIHDHEEEEKNRKKIESLARWDERKKWEKNKDTLKAQVKELEVDNSKLSKTNQNLRSLVTRLEKEKQCIDSKLMRTLTSKSKECLNVGGDEPITAGTDSSEQTASTVDQLSLEVFELREAAGKTHSESRGTVERLKMEIRALKDRVESQEAQAVACELANKGDPKIIAEIEKMVKTEEALRKEIIRLDQENLHLNLQMEQLKMDTPRLRDRVQHLQKMVDVLKLEKPIQPNIITGSSCRTIVAFGSSSKSAAIDQKSIAELQKTIDTMKIMISKLHNENTRLKQPQPTPNVRPKSHLLTNITATRSTEKLKSSIAELLEEKQLLLDQIHQLEHEKQKYHQMYLDATSTINHLQDSLVDHDKKAKSAEMKLKSFLSHAGGGGGPNIPEPIPEEPSGNEKMFRYMREMQAKLERKEQLLSEAKEALKEAAIAGEKQHKK